MPASDVRWWGNSGATRAPENGRDRSARSHPEARNRAEELRPAETDRDVGVDLKSGDFGHASWKAVSSGQRQECRALSRSVEYSDEPSRSYPADCACYADASTRIATAARRRRNGCSMNR